MSMNPHVSPEACRRVHQTLQNIRRLNNYKRERERLEREQGQLAHEMITSELVDHCTIHQVSMAICSGQKLLAAGYSYPSAIQAAFDALSQSAVGGPHDS